MKEIYSFVVEVDDQGRIRGRGLTKKELAEKMAGIEEGRTIWRGEDEKGRPIGQHVIKGPDDSDYAGLVYGIEALGARKARGDEISQEEIEILIERARKRGWDDPEGRVMDLLRSWERVAKSHDEEKERGW